MSEEIERIKREYARRDSAGLGRMYSYANPAFRFHIQEREWALLRALDREGIDLSATDVLEVGCGTGHILQRFLDFGARSATGIDLMPNRVCAGKIRYPALRLIQADAGHLPFASESFGLAMQFMCLSSVLDPELRDCIADEMWRILAPGGLILSYDLRPSPLPARAVNFIAHHLLPMAADTGPSGATPIKPLKIRELKALYPSGRMRASSLSLSLNLAGVARLSHTLAHLLACVPALRSHYLAVIRKPLRAGHDRK